MKFLLLSSVSNQVFDNLPVHQRFSTEEIHFQIASASGIGDQKVKCFLSDFIRHQRTSSVILPLLGKTIATRQITVMGNMQTECFHNRLALFDFVYVIFINIFRKKLSCFCQLRYRFQNLLYFFRIRFFSGRFELRKHHLKPLRFL